MKWLIRITDPALVQLQKVKDRRIRRKLIERIDDLAQNPESQGKSLVGELVGYRSVRAAGQRYRIIYQVETDGTVVIVAALGIRKDGDKRDVYALAKKLIRLGLA